MSAILETSSLFARLSALLSKADVEELSQDFSALLADATQGGYAVVAYEELVQGVKRYKLSWSTTTHLLPDNELELTRDISREESLLERSLLETANAPTDLLSCLAVPLLSPTGAPIGRVVLSHQLPDYFTAEHQATVELLCAPIAAVMENLQRKKQAESALQSYQTCIDTLDHLLFTLDIEGRMVWSNSRFREYTGDDDPETLEYYLNAEYSETAMWRWQECLRSCSPFEMALPIRSKEGTYRSFLTKIAPGVDERWYGSCTDMEQQQQREEALKASEERLKAVLAATPECVKIVAPDGSILFMNDAGRTMIEVPEEHDVRGAHVERVIPEKFLDEWREFHKKVCNGEHSSWQCEIVGLGGTRRWVETNAVPLRLADGTVAHLAVTRDISERKRLELEREILLESERAARHQAERASASKDEFVAILSHELRSPLNAILGWTQMLRKGKSNPERLQYGLEIIERNTRTQAQLISDLLDINRIVSGKLNLDVKNVELDDIVRKVIESHTLLAEEKQIEILKSFDENGISARVDPARFQQILWNLLTNAVKFAPVGGRVEVLVEQADGFAQISVSDNGEGIDPEVLPVIFDRYRQADSSSVRKHGGLGLGLFIVKRLTELHGGNITAESQGKGKGARFTLRLPLVTTDVRRAGESTDLYADLDLAGTRILAIDDEKDAREIVATLLESRRAEVVTAPSVDSGLALVKTWRPDLVISDIGMPGKDGYHFIRTLRALPPEEGGETPAIALTAFSREEDQTRALALGFQRHLSKPLEVRELCAAIADIRQDAACGKESVAGQHPMGQAHPRLQ